MGVDAIYTVWCDDEDCIEWTAQEPTRRMAAASAREAGWRRTRSGWRCPLHRADVCGEPVVNGVWCSLPPHGPEVKHSWL